VKDGAARKTARLFQNGRSQAVRLPREFRFEGKEVSIRREGDAVLLEPIRPRSWPRGYWKKLSMLRRGVDLRSFERPPDPPPVSSRADFDEL